MDEARAGATLLKGVSCGEWIAARIESPLHVMDDIGGLGGLRRKQSVREFSEEDTQEQSGEGEEHMTS